jgi:hypothetical protein
MTIILIVLAFWTLGPIAAWATACEIVRAIERRHTR